MQEGAGHAVLNAYVEIVLDNSDGRIQVLIGRPSLDQPARLCQCRSLRQGCFWLQDSQDHLMSVLCFPSNSDMMMSVILHDWVFSICIAVIWKVLLVALRSGPIMLTRGVCLMQFEKSEIRLRRTVGLKKDTYQLQKKTCT